MSSISAIEINKIIEDLQQKENTFEYWLHRFHDRFHDISTDYLNEINGNTESRFKFKIEDIYTFFDYIINNLYKLEDDIIKEYFNDIHGIFEEINQFDNESNESFLNYIIEQITILQKKTKKNVIRIIIELVFLRNKLEEEQSIMNIIALESVIKKRNYKNYIRFSFERIGIEFLQDIIDKEKFELALEISNFFLCVDDIINTLKSLELIYNGLITINQINNSITFLTKIVTESINIVEKIIKSKNRHLWYDLILSIEKSMTILYQEIIDKCGMICKIKNEKNKIIEISHYFKFRQLIQENYDKLEREIIKNQVSEKIDKSVLERLHFRYLEAFVAVYLEKEGFFTILNYPKRNDREEIDIIGIKKDCLIFVDCKAKFRNNKYDRNDALQFFNKIKLFFEKGKVNVLCNKLNINFTNMKKVEIKCWLLSTTGFRDSVREVCKNQIINLIKNYPKIIFELKKASDICNDNCNLKYDDQFQKF